MSNEDVGSGLRQVCVDNEAYVLSRAALIVPKEILNKTIQFDDVFPPTVKLMLSLHPCKLLWQSSVMVLASLNNHMQHKKGFVEYLSVYNL